MCGKSHTKTKHKQNKKDKFKLNHSQLLKAQGPRRVVFDNSWINFTSQGLSKSIYFQEFLVSSCLQFEWDFEKDLSFKDKMASVTTDFCTENRPRCALKDSRRKRLSLILYRVS